MSVQSSPLALGTENIQKLLIKYALPAIVAMTAASLYNMMDSIFIGHGVGPMAIAGLAITLPFMNIAAAAGSLVGVGASALMSMKLGQKDHKSASLVLGNVILLNVILGGIFTIISLIFLDPILLFFGASEITLPYAREYMVVILLGNIVTHVYMGLNEVLRASGYPQKAMFATLFAVAINGVLNYLFIFVMDMGIRGAALGTICAQALSLAFIVLHFADTKNFIHFKRDIWVLKPHIVKGMLAIGLSPFLMNLCASLVVILINNGLKTFGGDLAIGAYGIVNRIAFLFIMINMGFNQGMQPIAGFNYGARKLDRTMEVFKYTVICTTTVTTIGFITAQLFPRQLIMLFTTDEELIGLAVNGLRLILAAFPVVGFQMATSSFFQSIGMAKKAIFQSLTRQLIFLIPFLLILPQIWGENGVWISMPAADLAAFITAVFMIRYQVKKFKQEKMSIS
ncbi:MATE family efflux transporter [Odoribacter sp. OttesenSCG-928-G04]|nr:MATE family efflux transporter [Odoribacter sp. OttesenSCG-928-G04]